MAFNIGEIGLVRVGFGGKRSIFIMALWRILWVAVKM
jgi:hypothetical protein